MQHRKRKIGIFCANFSSKDDFFLVRALCFCVTILIQKILLLYCFFHFPFLLNCFNSTFFYKRQDFELSDMILFFTRCFLIFQSTSLSFCLFAVSRFFLISKVQIVPMSKLTNRFVYTLRVSLTFRILHN